MWYNNKQSRFLIGDVRQKGSRVVKMRVFGIGLMLAIIGAAETLIAADVRLEPTKRGDSTGLMMRAIRRVHESGGGTVYLSDCEYHFYSPSATKMNFHVSNHDQPEERPVFLPLLGMTNVTISAKSAKFVMHGMGTAMLLRETCGVTVRGVTVEWDRPFLAKAKIVGFERGKTRIRFPGCEQVGVKNGRLMLYGEDWESVLRSGNIFDHATHEMIERTADVGFKGFGSACGDGTFLIDIDLSKLGAGAKVGDVYVLRSGSRPHPIVCLDRAKDTVFENFVFRDGFGMGILAQLSENVTLRGGGCYPRSRDEYSSNVIDATHFSNCRGIVTVENCRFEGMMDDALNVHSTCLGIVARLSDNVIRCRYMHAQAVGLGVFAVGDAVRFLAGKTLENGAMGRVKSVETHDEREITLTLEESIPSEYGAGDAVENADWQCAVVFRNNTVSNNRARGILLTTPHRVVCEGNFFDHVSGSAILLAGDAQGWYESGACEDVVIRRNRFRDCLTSVFQFCDGLISIHPEVKDLAGQKRRYHRNILVEDNDIETFDVPLLAAISAEDVTWRNNCIRRHERYRGWRKPSFAAMGCERLNISSELSDGWRFAKGLQTNGAAVELDDGCWERVSVPHDWAITGPFDASIDCQSVAITQNGEKSATVKTGRTGSLPWIGEGWYRRLFSVPAGCRRARLTFEGAMSEPEVYVDGRLVAWGKNGYVPLTVDLSFLLPSDGREHLLAVHLANREQSSRWYPGAGLYRRVRLQTDLAAEDICIRTESVKDGEAVVSVSCDDSARRHRVFDVDGLCVAEGTDLLKVKSPRLWTPESPVLYRMEPEGVRFGIRTTEMSAEGFRLNGVVRKFKGVCLHHDLGPLGAAFHPDAFRRQVRLLKEMGSDAIRTSHNCPNPQQLEICDEEGMLVMAESFDAWLSPKCKNDYSQHFAERFGSDMTNIVLFCRNHPSVVMWSIGNEIPDQGTSVGLRTARILQDICHRLDGTRPVTLGIDMPTEAIRSGVLQEMDVAGLNYRLHKYAEGHAAARRGLVLGTETASTMTSRGVYHFPDRPSVKEVRTDGQCSSYALRCGSWSNLPDDDQAVQEDNPWTMGEFVWTGFDYLGEPTPYDEFKSARSSYFGIFDLAGLPKDSFWFYRSRWRKDSPTLHVLPHWTWPGREGQVTPVYVYTSYPTAELFVNGKSRGKRSFDRTSRLDRYRLRWQDVVYEPGEIRVVAYDKDGRPAQEIRRRTAGAPRSIVCEADSFGGRRMVFVKVRIVDEAGELCPDDDRTLRFSVRGDCRFVVCCNGDATSHEIFSNPGMKVFHGESVVILERTGDGSAALEITDGGKLEKVVNL